MHQFAGPAEVSVLCSLLRTHIQFTDEAVLFAWLIQRLAHGTAEGHHGE